LQPRQADEREFVLELERWIASGGEALADLFLHHSGGVARQYLLKSAEDAGALFNLARTDGTNGATLTGFRNGYYPLRGLVDESFVARARAAWPSGRWYHIVDLTRCFPEDLKSIGSGNTAEELEADLAALLTELRGRWAGFGEHPFDSEDWLDRHGVEAIETKVAPPPPESQQAEG